MGGLGLTVYINEVPITPRERDYVFVGSFLAFSIWVAMSLPALVSLISQKIKNATIPAVVAVLILLAGPGLMA